MMAADLTTAEARDAFLREHIEEVYFEVTGGLTEAVRVEDLVFRAAERYPGLVPTRVEMMEERSRRQSQKLGLEVDQGRFLSRLLARPRPGRHLLHAMRLPRREALERLDGFRTTGRADLGLAVVERKGTAGHLELRNPRFLNAEDDDATAALEVGVDLVLLDPQIEVGVLRGAFAEHPSYAGRRVFNAGLNLTHLYHGRISLAGFMMAREMGLLSKIQRGHGSSLGPGLEDGCEKPWIAAVETFAIGGGCQLLLVMDRVLAERGSYFNLPARKEGIIPGAAPLRLTRFLGGRLARQAVMFERSFEPDSEEGRLLCDEVVEPGGMDAAIDRDAAQLMSAGAVSIAANRRAIRLGEERLDDFRLYMAMYAREQARCMYSPALIDNLERNWRARERHL
jgi:(3,5-dihydroxyphenyl)acetyl-CoA 1,2-dioxygenase